MANEKEPKQKEQAAHKGGGNKDMALALASLGAAQLTRDNDNLKAFTEWFEDYKDKVKAPQQPAGPASGGASDPEHPSGAGGPSHSQPGQGQNLNPQRTPGPHPGETPQNTPSTPPNPPKSENRTVGDVLMQGRGAL
jgi:hypothetical protein